MNSRELRNRLAKLTQEEREEIQFRIIYGEDEDHWSSIYIIKCQDFYKIGRAWNLNDRVGGLQVGNPFPLELVYAVKHPKAKELEALLHDKYKENNVRGEWFRLDTKIIEEIKLIVENSWKYE